MKGIVFITSSGGSAIGAFLAGLRDAGCRIPKIFIFTDRPCGAESLSAFSEVVVQRIELKDNRKFSQECSRRLVGKEISFLALFFSRLISEDLYEKIPCYNFHPSLLPAYAGFGAPRRALEDGVFFSGVTMHLVNGEIDSGKIVAQGCFALAPNTSRERYDSLAFVHKVALLFYIFEKNYLPERDYLCGDDLSEMTGQLFNPAIQYPPFRKYLLKLWRENLVVNEREV